MRGADGVEGIIAVGAGEQAEGEQQRQRAEARHQQIDVARPQVLAQLVMRDHQRPGGERHEFPRHQETEGIVRHAPPDSWRRDRPDRTAARAAGFCSCRP